MATLASLSIKVTIAHSEHGVHVIMDRREHDNDSLDCWCGPEFFTVCDECDAGCWRCDRRLIQIDYATADATDETVVIVHAGVAVA